jgi:asparagine synthase (glutamine-hydrolysing)
VSLDAPSWRAQGLQPIQYWSLRSTAERGLAHPFAGDASDACDELENALRNALRLQMIADVPLGALLSGGVDSSTLVALMQTQSDRPIRTYSIGFREPGFDEAPGAAAVARHLGTEHSELYVTSSEAMAAIPHLPTVYDEPFADSSQIPTIVLARLARRHVTVAVTGDGGDELFGGYARYFQTAALYRVTRWLPRPMRRAAAWAMRALPPDAWNRAFALASPVLPAAVDPTRVGDRIHKLAELLTYADALGLYRSLVSHWPAPAEVVPDALEPPTALADPAHWADLADLQHRLMYIDMASYLPDDLLVKIDRASMSVGLETRAPLLDHRVVELAWQLPLSMKIRGSQGKHVLREVLRKYVPDALTSRPKKGFGVPLGTWLRGSLRDWAEELLDEARLRREGYFASEPIRRKWAEHLSGRRNWQYHLWDVLMFQAWLQHQGT